MHTKVYRQRKLAALRKEVAERQAEIAILQLEERAAGETSAQNSHQSDPVEPSTTYSSLSLSGRTPPAIFKSREEVFYWVADVLRCTLAVEESEITANAKLSADLNAESIDYLDITFSLEKCFRIKIPKGELFPENIFTHPEYVQNGKMTPLGLNKLKEIMSGFADLSTFEANPDINNFRDVFTVDTLVNFVCRKLEIPTNIPI